MSERTPRQPRRGPWNKVWARRAVVDTLLHRLEAGASLAEALRAVAPVAPLYAAALAAAAAKIESGEPPARALAPLGAVIPVELPALLSAGDASPTPAAVAALRRGVVLRRALLDHGLARLAYPLLATACTIGVLVPWALTIRSVFAEAGHSGPPPGLGSGALAVFAGLAVAAVLLVRAHRRSPTAYRLLGALPVLGATLRRACGAAFADALGVLLRIGRPLDTALREAAARSGYRVLEGPMKGHAEAVAQGHDLVDVLRDERLLPAELVWLIGRHGDAPLPDRLADVADVLADDARRSTETLVQALFPALIVALAVVVGIAVVQAYGTLFDGLSASGWGFGG